MLLAVFKVAVSNVDVVARIALALVLGGLVGFEREVSHQPAGLRTHITVALGAALFGVVSVHGFDAYTHPRADTNYQIDVTRVASQVVVGIGFLGAGAILKEAASVRGLTTAASLWATAAIGLAVGIGSFLAAFVTTGALLLSLVGLRAPRAWVRRRLGRGRKVALIRLREGADPAGTVRALLDVDQTVVRTLSVRQDDQAVVIQADVVGPVGGEVERLLSSLADRDEVTDVEIG